MAKTVIGATIDIDVKNSSKSIDELNKEIEQLNQTLKESQENSELYQNALKKIEQLEAELAKKTKELAKETNFTLYLSPTVIYDLFTLNSSTFGILNTNRLGW